VDKKEKEKLFGRTNSKETKANKDKKKEKSGKKPDENK